MAAAILEGTERLPIAVARGQGGGNRGALPAPLRAAQGLAGRGGRRARGRALAALPVVAPGPRNPDLRRPGGDGARGPGRRADARAHTRRGLEGDPGRGPGHRPEAVRRAGRDRAAPRGRCGDVAGRGGRGPRPGHFCMVGDAQQGIYSSGRHPQFPEARRGVLERGGTAASCSRSTSRSGAAPGGAPAQRDAAGGVRTRARAQLGRPGAEGAPAPPSGALRAAGARTRQRRGGGVEAARSPRGPVVRHEAQGRTASLRTRPARSPRSCGGGPGLGRAARGATSASCARNAWLPIIRDELEAAGLKTALQMRRNRNGDNPVYAWLCGLLAVVCDPENTFEWVGRAPGGLRGQRCRDRGGRRGRRGPALGRARTTRCGGGRRHRGAEAVHRPRRRSRGVLAGSRRPSARAASPKRPGSVDPEGGLEDELDAPAGPGRRAGRGGAGRGRGCATSWARSTNSGPTAGRPATP
jgi:hypothetical protein